MKFKAIEDPDGNMYEIATNVVLKCSDAGMTPDDDNSNNFALLCKAIEQADTVVVDGVYKLKEIACYDLDKNLELIGSGKGSGFEYVSGGSLFSIRENCTQVNVQNLTITNATTNVVILFSREVDVTGRMNYFKIENCTFKGRLSPARFYQDTEINPDETVMGVNTISVLNSTFVDISNSCLTFENVSYNMLELKGNTIHNFDNTFVHGGVTNETMYEKEITQSKKHFVVENNDVSCDDTFYHNESSTSTYYVFALAEGVNATYRRNKVEGMKSRITVALYDAYLSCENVVYEHNVWKNNACLVAYANNTLIKAKGNGGTAGARKYHNNTFVVEKDFFRTT